MLNKIALVSGASGEIGHATAVLLSKQGFKLVLCGNKNEICHDGMETEFFNLKFDISDPLAVKTAFETAEKRFGKLDLVVCNAGTAESENLLIDESDENIQKLIEVNLTGTIFCNKYACLHMKKGGCIVNVSSFLGVYGCSCESVYAAAKAGIIGLTKSLAKEFSAFDIRVNSISPGYIDTKMNNDYSDDAKTELIARTPVKRLGRAQEVAEAISFLAGSEFVCGENLIVSGGLEI